MITNGISLNALTDALIFMAVAMAVARSLRLWLSAGTRRAAIPITRCGLR